MSYEVELSSKAYRQYKKLEPALQKKFKEEIESLFSNPGNYSKLSGKYSNLRKLKFKTGGNSYRIVFTIIENKRKVIIVFIGGRENFYKKLKQYLD